MREASNEDMGEVVQITINGDLELLRKRTNSLVKISASDNKYNPRVKLDFSGAPIGEYDLFSWNSDTPEYNLSISKIENGQTCGYRYTDITYAGDLISGIGEPVTSMLDKVVAMLGNFEYFYDLDGRFVFQRKRTYLDKTWNSIVTGGNSWYVTTSDETYVESAAWSSAVSWNLTDSFLVTAFNNTPAINNIKNDFSIWGTKTSITGSELPVHLRYALDTKPKYYKTMKERDERLEKGYAFRSEVAFLTREYYQSLVESGKFNEEKFIICDWREIIFQMALDYRQHDHEDDFPLHLRLQNGRDENGEWRYPTGKTGYEQYYIDLEGFWRQLYCPPQF